MNAIWKMTPFRHLRSIWDYFAYFEFGLSRQPLLWFVFMVLAFATPGLIGALGLRDWTVDWKLGLILASLTPVFKFVVSRTGPNRQKSIDWADDAELSAISRDLRPSPSDADAGFRNVPAKNGFDGAVHLSDSLNSSAFQRDDWDCPLALDAVRDRSRAIRREIRTNARYFRALGWNLTKQQLFRKPLINEEKLGISSDLFAEMDEIVVVRTDYYSTRCTGESSLLNFSEKLYGRVQTTLPAISRVPFNLAAETPQLNPMSSEHPLMSNQIGVNLLGITRDGYLAVCRQSKQALQGRGRRVPLATGSADWDDFETGDTIKGFVERAILRELAEEWGNNKDIRKFDPLQADDLIHLGFFRIPNRGGKPEFATLARLNWTVSQLTPDESEVEKYVQSSERDGVEFAVNSLEDLNQAISSLLEHRGALPDSSSLYGSLICLQSACENHPDRVSRLLA